MRLFGGAFFVEKSCCFILPKGFRTPLHEGAAFDARLSALLYHLTFAERIKIYFFIYDEESVFSANRILGSIRDYASDLCRILIFPEKGAENITFRFLAENRFESRKTVSPATFEDRESLYRSLIETSDIAVFCFDEQGEYPIERRAFSFAEECGKKVIDLARTGDLPAWFQRR